MKTINNIYGLALAALSALALASCDNIAEGDRLIYVKPAEVSKNVLIEDFTGQRCKNCPEATETIHELQEAYGGDKVIAVGLYSGPFGKKVDGSYLPLTTETGDYYYNHWGVEAQPCLNIDRKGMTSDNQILQTKVTSALQTTTPVSISLTSAFDGISKCANLDIEVESSETIENAYLQVWLTEDSIQGAQIMPNGRANSSYTHNHVFRSSVTDRDGAPISLVAGKKVTISLDASIDTDNWDFLNMHVVAFVFNSDGVLQTVAVPVFGNVEPTE